MRNTKLALITPLFYFRFIDTQGLRQLFDECDNYVWRLGFKKKLPSGIIYDGGSDWFGLHRDFCEYAVYSNDSLVTGLKKYADHSFSPLEVSTTF